MTRPAAPSSLPRVASFGDTDIGLVRRQNEDAFLTNDAQRHYVLADGMGGHAAGEVAAAEGCGAALGYLRRHPRLSLPKAAQGAVAAAHEAVVAAARGAGREGMGATLVVLAVGPGRSAVAHVGDSRCYQMRPDRRELTALTEDHALGRHVVLRALGHEGGDQPDVREVTSGPGDLFLLCSDGLHGVVEPSLIGRFLRAALPERGPASLQKAVWQLIGEARRLGAPDNVTAVLVRVES